LRGVCLGGVPMIGVVVPVHDEQTLLGDCLQSVRQAAADPLLDAEPVEIVVVLDACTDRSAAIAIQHHAQIVSLNDCCVGAARALGASWALDYGARWVAFTDADTIVPPNWLSAQLGLYADATCGQVCIDDWSAHPPGVRERFLRHYSTKTRHVHGANLGISATAYHTAGGFPALKSGEDWALISSLLERRGDVRWAESARVVTSARWQTTIDDGFAAHLAGLREQCCAETAFERITARVNA
jgi:glycosyltransferase involved in cell wall biosynthesis